MGGAVIAPAVLLRVAVALMIVAAAQRLGDGLSCLLSGAQCGIDIRRFHPRVHDWFAGRPVPPLSTLPPASYPVLWLLLGWLPLVPALELWAATSVLALGWLGLIAAREGSARTRTEWAFMALLPSAMYAARATIINGQFTLHLLPPLLVGVLLVERRRPGWRRDLGGAALVLAALIKPSVAAPFVLLIALGDQPAERVRPLLLVVAGYAGLALLAGAFGDGGIADPWRAWLEGSVRQAAMQYGRQGAYGSLHDWLGALGLSRWNGAASLLALIALAVFLRRYRGADVWIRLGVTAVAARLWTYHRVYDDMLILLPMIALFRLWTRADDRHAAFVLAVVWMGALAPARLFFLPSPWNLAFMALEQLTWLLALGSLLRRAARATGPRPDAQPA